MFAAAKIASATIGLQHSPRAISTAFSMLILLAVAVDVGVVSALMLLAGAFVGNSCFVAVAAVVVAAGRTFKPGGDSSLHHASPSLPSAPAVVPASPFRQKISAAIETVSQVKASSASM